MDTEKIERWLKELLTFIGSLALGLSLEALIFGPFLAPSIINDYVGRVSIKGQEPMNLVGVPGDKIRFRILQDSKSYWSSSDGFSLRLQNNEREFETVAAVVRPSKGSEGKILGSFVVPEVPGGGSLVLTGTLWGDLLIGEGQRSNLEVPVNLTVVPSGEGVTTGKKERRAAWTVYFISLALYLSAAPVCLVARAVRRRRSRTGMRGIGR